MKLGASGQVSKVITLLGVAYLMGALVYGADVGWNWLVQNRIPDPPWWQLLVGPLIVAFAWLGLEAFGTFVGNGFTFDDTKQTKWQRIAGLVGMFLLLTALIFGVAAYQIIRS